MSIGDRPDKKSPDLEALFGGLGARGAERERHPMGHPSAQLGHQAHPTRARAAAAGIPVGRMVPTSDFGRRQKMKTHGVPSIGLAPPRQPEQGDQPPVQQYRQLTGLPPNNRSNQFLFIASQHLDPGSGTPPTLTLGFDQPILQLNGAVDDTDMVAIQLGLNLASQLQTLGAGASFNFTALLQWGVGNATFTAEVDWKLGTILTLPSNFLSIKARVPVTDASVPDILLSCGLAYGTAPAHRSRATFTVFSGNVAHGGVGVVTVPIPPWATSFGCAPRSFQSGFAGPIVVQPSAAGVANAEMQIAANGSQIDCETFTIPNGSTELDITNQDSAKDTDVVVIFGMPF